MTLLTPAEARQKACPFYRDPGSATTKPTYPCLASECVWWRWKPVSVNDHRFLSAVARETAAIEDERKGKAEKPKKSASSEAAERVGFNVDGYIVRTDNDKGYCGGAGRPE